MLATSANWLYRNSQTHSYLKIVGIGAKAGVNARGLHTPEPCPVYHTSLYYSTIILIMKPYISLVLILYTINREGGSDTGTNLPAQSTDPSISCNPPKPILRCSSHPHSTTTTVLTPDPTPFQIKHRIHHTPRPRSLEKGGRERSLPRTQR